MMTPSVLSTVRSGWVRASTSRLVEVSPPSELGGALRAGATVRWTEDGVHREVRTATPAALLRDVLAAVPTGEVPDLTVTRPGLEDVYLRLVGAVPSTEGDLR